MKKLIGYVISILISIVLVINPRLISTSDNLDVFGICFRVVFLIFALYLFSKAVEKYFE